MSVINQEYTEHLFGHDKPHPNCEWCDYTEENIIKNWFLKKWITYKEYLRLTGLPF